MPWLLEAVGLQDTDSIRAIFQTLRSQRQPLRRPGEVLESELVVESGAQVPTHTTVPLQGRTSQLWAPLLGQRWDGCSPR